MAACVHGWRFYTITLCQRTGEPALEGQYGMHVHSNPPPPARCRGFAPAMWMPEELKELARENPDKLKHSEADCPPLACSCGFYLFRSALPEDRRWGGNPVIAHVTCIGRVILHQEGARAARYRIDYFLKPWGPEERISGWGAPYSQVSLGTMQDLLEGIAAGLGVPILDPRDRRGCAECQIYNGWSPEKNAPTRRVRKYQTQTIVDTPEE